MLSKLKDKMLLQSFLVGLVGVLGSFILILNDFILYDLESLKVLWNESSKEIILLVIQSGVISFIITFLAYYFGKKANICIQEGNTLKINKKEKLFYFGLSFIVPVIVTIVDYILYKNNILTLSGFAISELVSNLVYNGVIEEIWFRLGLTSVLIFLVHKVFSKEKKVTKKYFFIGLILSSLFLFAWQIYSVFTIFYFDVFLLLKVILSYLLMSLIFNMIYLKHGLKYSLIFHIIYIISYVGICPLFIGLLQ